MSKITYQSMRIQLLSAELATVRASHKRLASRNKPNDEGIEACADRIQELRAEIAQLKEGVPQ